MSHTAEPNDRRWYCVNTIGMATLCRDEADARREAADADAMWPRHAPHVATQLVPMAEIDRLRARVASLEESIHYANGVADLAMKHRDDAENRVAELEQDAEIGRKWRADSSLATWFPFTAEEIERLPARWLRLSKMRPDYCPLWNEPCQKGCDPKCGTMNAWEALRKENERLRARVADGFDLIAHLTRQREFSERTFGPGTRTKGVIDHIRKELIEIEAKPDDLSEWVDVILLALDGAWRTGHTPQQICEGMTAKQVKNEARTWPDWRTADPNKAIEHDRSKDGA